MAASVILGCFINSYLIFQERKSLPERRLLSGSLPVGGRFLDLCSFALQAAQIVQLRPADLTLAHHLNAVHTGRMQRERTLYADAIGHAADGEGFAGTAVTAGDDGTFESLLTKHLKADGTISPAKDGRMTIIWD